MNLYHEHIMDHYRYPRNRIPLVNYNAHSSLFNHSCGDEIKIYLLIIESKIQQVSYSASGCVISQAVASMLSQEIKEKSVDQIIAFTIDDLINLIKISLGPVRLKCATLSLQAVQDALRGFVVHL